MKLLKLIMICLVFDIIGMATGLIDGPWAYPYGFIAGFVTLLTSEWLEERR